MNDSDKLEKVANAFYQYINDLKKHNPELEIISVVDYAHEFAMLCGFDHPRCFVKYIEDLEYERSKNDLE